MDMQIDVDNKLAKMKTTLKLVWMDTFSRTYIVKYMKQINMYIQIYVYI